MVDNKLNFEPNKIYQFKFNFLLQKQDMNKELEVSSISLELGNKDTRVLVINWKGDCKNGLSSEDNTIMSFARSSSLSSNSDCFSGEKLTEKQLSWESIKILPVTRLYLNLTFFLNLFNRILVYSLVSRKAYIEIKLEHKTPILIDELYVVKLTIENKEENLIKNLSLSVDLHALNDLDGAVTNKICKYFSAVSKDLSC